jgi:acyl-CoA thioesterase
MDPNVKCAIEKAVQREALAKVFRIKLVALDSGFSAVEMIYEPAVMSNIYDRAHGGAIFALIDEAFETACQTHGTIAVASSRSPGGKPDQKDRQLRYQGR